MDNRLNYYLSKVERQLDFHRGLHLFEMERNPNFTNNAVFLKESQNEYITNLFGDNKNIRESYEREFNGNVIVESTFNHKNEVEKFFSFLKESFVNEVTKSNILSEQEDDDDWFGKSWIKNISKEIDAENQKRNDALAKMTPEQKAAFLKSEADIKAKNDSAAYSVVNALKRAFDLNGDNVFDDYDGTNEDDAVKAIDLIVNKNILDKVNQIIGSQIKPYGDLRAWVNDEMSDFDPTQYRAIWKRLEGLGYSGANYNTFLAAAGAGVDLVKKGFTWLKEKGIPWFFEQMRDILMSTGGAILQTLLDYTGVGALGVTAAWAALTLFDVSQIASGIGSWGKLFFSVIGLCTAGALAKIIGKFLKPFFGAGGTIGSFFQKIAKQSWFVKYVKPWVSKIGGALSWASGLIKQAGTWVVEKLGATTIGGMVTKAAAWMEQLFQGIVKWSGTGAASETKLASNLGIKKLTQDEISKEGKKLAKKAVYDPLKDELKTKSADVTGYVAGDKAKTALELGYGVGDYKKILTKDFKGAVKAGDYAKTADKGYKAYDEFGNLIDKATQLASDGSSVTNAANFIKNGNNYVAANAAKTTTNVVNPVGNTTKVYNNYVQKRA
jgi:predicted kinase